MRGKSLIKPNLININEEVEPYIDEINFKIYKFNTRVMPNRRSVIVFPCFSEFGTEILGTLYCIPRLMQQYFKGKYSIAMGWHGRSFLYKRLVDEFWEIDEKHQWLRKYCRAFHHYSQNLTRIEKNSITLGTVQNALVLGLPATYPKIDVCLVQNCGGTIQVIDGGQQCIKCNVVFPQMGLFYDHIRGKKDAVWPIVSSEKKIAMSKYLKPNSVGITARNRDAYGRNLPSIFYERLIYLLEDLGYNPIWIGEKETILPCPFSRITDFSVTQDAKDLENTLALVSQLKFTIQFWTASTRLAGMVGTPYIIFESADQIFGGSMTPGHEGFRSFLCTKGNSKLVMANYNSVLEDHNAALTLVDRAVHDIEAGNFSDIIGLVDEEYWRHCGRKE